MIAVFQPQHQNPSKEKSRQWRAYRYGPRAFFTEVMRSHIKHDEAVKIQRNGQGGIDRSNGQQKRDQPRENALQNKEEEAENDIKEGEEEDFTDDLEDVCGDEQFGGGLYLFLDPSRPLITTERSTKCSAPLRFFDHGVAQGHVRNSTSTTSPTWIPSGTPCTVILSCLIVSYIIILVFQQRRP